MYVKRHLESKVIRGSRSYPVVLVCGQRQVGKSTMLFHIKEDERRVVSFDDINVRRLAESDPALFFETYKYPLLIDEFQRVPSILLEMKKIVDQKGYSGEDNNGMFWLTGSQQFRMMKNVSESLAGRIVIYNMSSFSSAEIENRPDNLFDPDISSLRERLKSCQKKNIHQIYDEIFKGSMPKLRTTDIDRDEYYGSYINTYLDRDIRDLSKVGKLKQFEIFLTTIASRTGQELKYSDIANTVGVSAPTVREWISILESTGIIFMLNPYYPNISKRLTKMPKLYFMDTGLAAYLCHYHSAELLEYGPMSGAFLETYVVSEIVKSYYNSAKPLDLYYYRDIDKKEIDLIIVKENKLYPIEIKRSRSIDNPDKNFSALEKFNMDIQPGIILCPVDELAPLNRKCWFCPIFAI